MSTTLPFKQVSAVYNSSSFIAAVTVRGVDANTGDPFEYVFAFDETDPEFRQMFNDYGARLAVEALLDAEILVDENCPKDGLKVSVFTEAGFITGYREAGKWFDLQGEVLEFPPATYKLLK